MNGSLMAALLDAISFAAEKHRNQRRKDKECSPYINHPVAVARVLVREAGVSDLVTIQAAVLHDTIEDTATTLGELESIFGSGVAAVVAEVTDNKGLTKSERKRLQVENAPKKSHPAALVKYADKICNLRDLLDAPPAGWDAARKREYFDWARSVVDRLPPVSPELTRAFNAEYSRGTRLMFQEPSQPDQAWLDT
jgi:GTP diphosphokinase / guanosine-3',5'-bis(diphosphate) 3'-diphosphatase